MRYSADDVTAAGTGGRARAVVGVGLTAALATLFGVSTFTSYADSSVHAGAHAHRATGAASAPTASQPTSTAMATRFATEVWPILAQNCVACHGQKNASQFLLADNPRSAFLKMVSEGLLDPENHTGIVERIGTTDDNRLMPPPTFGKLTRAQVATLTKFAEDLDAARRAAPGAPPDEQFPAYLHLAYSGAAHPEGMDNTFLTYGQLRGKIKTIFGDDWVRGDRDLFVENAALFGGADFIKRFDESARPSPTYFTGLDLLGRDIATKAYLDHAGPFAGFPAGLPSPIGMKTPSAAYVAAIDRLYDRMLFRLPTATEQAQAFALLQSVYRAETAAAPTASQDVRFALTVTDSAQRSVATQVLLHVTSVPGHSLYSEFLDQSKDAMIDGTGGSMVAHADLGRNVTLAPGDPEQQIRFTNEGTHGNVSIASVTLRGPLPATTEKNITIEDPSVEPEGAWRLDRDEGVTSYEDDNQNKGDSRLAIPLKVDKPGQYTITINWRKFHAPAPPKVDPKQATAAAPAAGATPPAAKPQRKRRRHGGSTSNAENVLVEVVSRDKTSELAVPAKPPVPPKGEADFFIDETLDTIPFEDLKSAFRFGPGDGVEVTNEGTRKRVVADAVRLMPVDAADDSAIPPVLLPAAAASGRDKWAKFQIGDFQAYNSVGPDIFQDTDPTGTKRENITIDYQPAALPKRDSTAAVWDPAKYYRVGIIFPGQVDNETRVPIVIHAQASSPIVQVVAPYHAVVGAKVTLDASSTFNLQHSQLRYHWTQIGGSRVTLQNPNAPVQTFLAPRVDPQQTAWEGLCRALLATPDFLFTRPRSLLTSSDPAVRRRLQLVKVAQDLVGRAPTAAEIARIDSGAPLSTLVDGYLSSDEFRNFYFRRVRLYVESHGTTEQDEPARLWTYIAMHDRPFKEILTANYTVDPQWRRQARPAYYGHTGVLTMRGFIEGKPGLPHFSYSAQVCEKFLGYVFEVPAAIVKMRNGITAAATTDPKSVCYTCHKVLTPLAFQRQWWDDAGDFRRHDDTGLFIDASDRAMVASYPFKGTGMEAFAMQAQNKERFVRAILQTHFVWYFGREMRYDTDERQLYKRLWDTAVHSHYALRPIIRAIVLSPEYLGGTSASAPAAAPPHNVRVARSEHVGGSHRMGAPAAAGARESL